MNKLKIFSSKEFGEIRTVTIDNEPWFVGKDVATALGYKDTSDALKKHVQDDDKLTRRFADSGQNRKMYIINESGLYALIFGSKLESAKRFKHWVTSEVLPSIRKHGGYIAGQENLSDDELMAKALMVAQRKIEEKNQIISQKELRIQEMRPKEIFADAVASSKTSILVGELAKILRQNGINIGQNRLYQYLRDEGYLIKRKGVDYNTPTQRSMDLGLFEIKEGSYINGNGCNIITKTPKVTGKGQSYFINKFLQKEIRQEEKR